jgi:hypothetical protein
MKSKTSIQKALGIIHEVWDLIDSAFDALYVGGSVRRGKAMVGDIELIGIPKSTEAFIARTDTLLRDGVIQKHDYSPDKPEYSHRWGKKYRGFDFMGMLVEIFTATPETFGYVYWLRTGPGDGNQAVMSLLSRNQSPVRMKAGQVFHVSYPDWKHGDYEVIAKLNVPDEETFFKLIGVGYVQSANRDSAYYESQMDSRLWKPAPIELIKSLYVDDVQPVQKSLF